MYISITVMADPRRFDKANALVSKLKGMPFDNVSIVWDELNNEWHTGSRALNDYAVGSDWHVVVQDDAILDSAFYANVVSAIENVPEKTIVSFYTGTVRPFPSKVKAAVLLASQEKASFIAFTSLFWGVGLAIKTELIPHVLEKARHSNLPYDRRIGEYFRLSNQKVYYTNPSIIDHDDTDSLLGHLKKEYRVAHWYTNEVQRFSSKSVDG